MEPSVFDSHEDEEDIPLFNGTVCEHPLCAEVMTALRTVYDPEIPVNIYDLGLIYTVDRDDDGNLDVKMSLTAPGCPVAGEMPGMVETALSMLPALQDKKITVSLVWDPPWTKDRMSEIARLELGMF